MVSNSSVSAKFSVTGIVVISAAMILGPLFSPSEFSIFLHSTSEQAGQQMPGAWIMRIGFIVYGFCVAVASLLSRPSHSLFIQVALIVFGIGLIGAGVWSNASIIPEWPSDMHEDLIHSICSNVVGTGFAAACAARLFTPQGNIKDVLAWSGMLMSIVFPLAMNFIFEYRGLIQRSMFVFSFIFVLREFIQRDINN